LGVKTTIDIPEPLYKRAKIRAIERGQTLKQIVLTSLERELNSSPEEVGETASPWAKRRLVPEFARLQAAGAFKPRPGDRDITELISEGREDRAV
jgi:hypothetical protein